MPTRSRSTSKGARLSKGISETFSENESKTAPRDGPAPVAEVKERPDGANQTRRMPKAALEHVLRTASGTRPAASTDQRARLASVIEEQLRADPEAPARPTLADAQEVNGNAALSLPTPIATFEPMPLEAAPDRSGTMTVPPRSAPPASGLPTAPPPPGASAPAAALRSVSPPSSAPSSIPASFASAKPASSRAQDTAKIPVSRRAYLPPWLLAVGFAGLVVLLAAAAATGFYFGRLTALGH